MSAQQVLVTGASSAVGAAVARRLTASGVAVRGMHRRPGQTQFVRQLGAEPVLGDFDDLISLRAAMRGCSDVLVVTPPERGQLARERRAIDVAVEMEVRRVVRVSASDSNRGTNVPWARDHAWADHYLAGSGLRWTSLRASGFMQNLVAAAPTVARGLLPQASGRGELPFIDVHHVAAVAHVVLTTDGHDGATYFLTGPESLSMSDVARKLSSHLHGTVRFLPLPGWAYLLLVRMSGQSWWKANGLRHQFAGVIRPGHDIDVTHEVRRLTGVSPTTMDEFIVRNIEVFQR